ncbi:hypothetical protein [Hymenobacter crusticola]|uniref:Uncharacterized protein n=1 Tax=Hymenobacter crusticola TaxID=1770526 RepID=A0A2C9ZTZ4_9BACT|nr:hypothetical protein [Hymenobacter crusticola]OUJ70179.1 hypothetical protein BXP70_25350 [Hymenobacter crusticola]
MPDSIQLNQPVSSDLVGYTALYALAVEEVLADPVVAQGQVIGDLELREGAGWHELKVTPGSIKFSEPPKANGRHGTIYPTKVTAQRGHPNAQTLYALDTMERRRYLVSVRDTSGRLRLIGNRQQYLTFAAGTEGSSPSARAGVDLSFTGDTLMRAPYYLGSFPLTSGGYVPVPSGPITGSVELRTAGGRLLATVPAGKRIVLRSGFKLSYEIE